MRTVYVEQCMWKDKDGWILCTYICTTRNVFQVLFVISIEMGSICKTSRHSWVTPATIEIGSAVIAGLFADNMVANIIFSATCQTSG